jgi:Superinfection immunity protein
MNTAAASSSSGASVVGVILLILVAFAAYWTPGVVAYLRKVPNLGSVLVINGLLGWTMVGWVVALAMACRSHLAVPVTHVTINNGGEEGRERLQN